MKKLLLILCLVFAPFASADDYYDFCNGELGIPFWACQGMEMQWNNGDWDAVEPAIALWLLMGDQTLIPAYNLCIADGYADTACRDYIWIGWLCPWEVPEGLMADFIAGQETNYGTCENRVMEMLVMRGVGVWRANEITRNACTNFLGWLR